MDCARSHLGCCVYSGSITAFPETRDSVCQLVYMPENVATDISVTECGHESTLALLES